MRSLASCFTVVHRAVFLSLAFGPILSLAQNGGEMSILGSTLVSAMMMFVGNEKKIYIIDKVENNPTQINGHPAWAVEWDIGSSKATTMDMYTNAFCSAGMHLPNGSFATFGGNGAITTNGAAVPNGGTFDPLYGDYDGGQSIRVLDPCDTTGGCPWFDNATFQKMQKRRWYAGAEPLADGTIVLIGGFVNGGYVNRNFPNLDPKTEGGAAEPTYEFWPPNGRPPRDMDFMTKTSGLNSYAHTFLMPSGKMFVQANLSTILWDYDSNQETPLPDMPDGVVRVYPASGAVAMLPLTPANNWTPTILFCGGSDLPADAYGDYAAPAVNTWLHPASQACHRITPEPKDGSPVDYVPDDWMLEGRTMGQFIILPDGTLLVVNGGANGTAGYADHTGQTPIGSMPFGMSLSSAPVLTPAIYDPNAPATQRWSRDGFQTSQIPRLYHSSAILMPDASVLIAGSNPNVDYNDKVPYPTEYRAEKFFPSYFNAATRPSASGIPKTLTYGGAPFDLVITPAAYTGSANEAAGNTTVVLMRSGFTTHAMNMGQRMLQLNNTFTVFDNGTIVLHVSQVPPNPNLLTPGPVFLHVVIHGIPSTGTYVIVGSGRIELQQVLAVPDLPPSKVASSNAASGSGATTKPSSSSISRGAVIGIVVGSVALLALLGTVGAIVFAKRKRSQRGFVAPDKQFPSALAPPTKRYHDDGRAASDASFIPLNPYRDAHTPQPTGGAWTPPPQRSPPPHHSPPLQRSPPPHQSPQLHQSPAMSHASFQPSHDPNAPYGDYDPYREAYNNRSDSGHGHQQFATGRPMY